VTVPQVAITKPRGPAGAPLVVLGASLGTTTVLWDGAAAFLSDRFRVLAFDHPGHGSSPAARDSFTVAEIGIGLLGALDSIGEREFHYAGLSLAGAVGLELVLAARDRVTSTAIVCSGAKIGEPAGWAERAAAVRTDGTASLVSGAAGRWFAPGSIERHPDITARLLNDLRDTDDESYALCCEALASYDVRRMLGQIAPPVLAIWAEHDEVTPESSAVLIADGVQVGRIHQIADASHLAPAERPAAVAAVLGEFFGGAR